MWGLTISPWEIILRAAIVYFGLFILFRLLGKKQLGKMSPFDLVLVLIISESVSNTLGAEEHSIAGGLLSATTLILLSCGMDFLSYRSRKFEAWADGEPIIIIRDGVINAAHCKKERITHREILEALREQGIEKLENVRIGFLETDGKITAFPRSE